MDEQKKGKGLQQVDNSRWKGEPLSMWVRERERKTCQADGAKGNKWEDELITLKYQKIRRQKRTPNPQKRWSAHTKSKASKSDLRRYATTKIQCIFLPLCVACLPACQLACLPACLWRMKVDRPCHGHLIYTWAAVRLAFSIQKVLNQINPYYTQRFIKNGNSLGEKNKKVGSLKLTIQIWG